MAEDSLRRKKTLRQKEKLLIMSNFSFFHSVFKRLVLQTHKNKGLFGKRLILYCTITPLPRGRKLLKTLLKREKILVTRISVFELHLFCHLQMLSIWTNAEFHQLVKSYSPLSQSVAVFYFLSIFEKKKRLKLLW